MMPVNSRRDRFAAGWVLGAVLALLETLRAGVPSARLEWGVMAATLGLHPLIVGAFALAVSTPSWFRQPMRLTVTLAVCVLFPWLTLAVFPYISVAALSHPTQWPRMAALLAGCLLLGAEIGRRHVPWGKLAPWGAAACVLGAVLTAAGCLLLASGGTTATRARASGEGPNVLLITLDTVRRDALGCYAGGDRGTPTLDSLASTGIRFTRTTSCAPWTLASMSSLMTGLNPSTTGVFTGQNRLAEGVTTLAEEFTSRGYYTHAIVTNAWLRQEFGIAQGFATYDHRATIQHAPRLYSFSLFRLFKRLTPQPAAQPESATDVVDQALRFLGSDPPTPFFLWLHFNDAHDPYTPPRRYLPRGSGYRGQFFASSGRIVRLRQGNRVASRDRDRIRLLYQSEITYIDDSLRRLLDGLRTGGQAARTLIAVTADHGEEFWEHRSVGHGHTLHAELLNVPLIISWPGMVPADSVCDAPTSLADVFPTLVDYAGFPATPTQGISVARETPADARPRIAEALEFFWEQKALEAGQWKLISEPENGRFWLYDVSQDPWEQYDLIKSHPVVAAAMESTLASHLARFRADGDRLHLASGASAMVLTPALREQLRAQGYLE